MDKDVGLDFQLSYSIEIYYVFSQYEDYVANIFLQKFDDSGNPVFSSPLRVVENIMEDNVSRDIYEIFKTC